MISVRIERNKEGVLLGCKAEGHAGYAARGFDIVCSAVSVLLRTVLQVAELTDGVSVKSDAGKRGFLDFTIQINEPGSEPEKRLVYAGDFLETGLKSVAEEYPGYVELLKKTV